METQPTKKEPLLEGERAIVIAINGDMVFRNFLLANGISIGSIITKNFSPTFSKLVNFSVGGKMISLRIADFDRIEAIKI